MNRREVKEKLRRLIVTEDKKNIELARRLSQQYFYNEAAVEHFIHQTLFGYWQRSGKLKQRRGIE